MAAKRGSQDKMENHLEEFRKALKSAEEWQRSLEKLVDDPESSSKEQVEELEDTVGAAAQMLFDFQDYLSQWTVGGDVHSDSPTYQSIPELRTVPWKTLSNLRSPDKVHYAVEYSLYQPTETDLDPNEERASKSRTNRRSHKARAEVKEPQQNCETSVETEETDSPPSKTRQGPRELPERVRINSQRLAIFLDYNVHDRTLAWSSYERTPLCFLRPYKFLVSKNEQIRSELKDMERIRSDRRPGTEEEYNEELKRTLPEDEIPPHEVKLDAVPVVQLTALIKDLRCLVKFMDEFVQPSIERIWSRTDHVFFSDLWYLYPAGSLIYVKNKKVPQKIWKVIQRTSGRRYMTPPIDDHYDHSAPWFLKFTPFVIDCFHIDYDGSRYVRTYETLRIEHFEGFQPVTSLLVLPLQAAEEEGLVDRKVLIARGQDFVKCTRASHREYVGRNQILRPNGLKLNQKMKTCQIKQPDSRSG
ncbi:hypothetical protein EJ04DRAFT_604115 [Polyplosphaeria fusca]|uniref:DUF7025 domain-containing protein n=1 Tax=Polyplosphaeria fusca TaxID=682080 RepID=A0A9P4QU51_9PLEO|nr:hypothetical protein EJ04DRAFT_604115 [Polyplosphaeria fusca]